MPKKDNGDRCGARPVDSCWVFIRCGRPAGHKGRHKGGARLADGSRRTPLDTVVRWGDRTRGLHCNGCEGHCDGEGVV